MKYKISRSSDFRGRKAPVEGAQRIDDDDSKWSWEWVVDVPDLLAFVKEHQERIILGETDDPEYPFEIEIYDDYRE